MIVIVLRILWYDIIVLNVHEPTGDKSKDSKRCPVRHQNRYFVSLLGTGRNSVRRLYSTKLGRKYILNPQQGMRIYMKIIVRVID